MQKNVLFLVTLVTILAAAPRAHAGVNGMAEAGVGVDVPVADSGYRHDFSVSPSLYVAGIYLPRYASRALGVEMDVELTPYNDDYKAYNGAQTDFLRVRLDLGARYLRPLAPGLTGFARALAGLDMVNWTQKGVVGIPYTDSDTHIGLALEVGAGVLYRLGPVTVGGQLAIPVGIHRQTIYDMGVAIDHDAFDVELRLTVGTNY